jgi:hypothetical protein
MTARVRISALSVLPSIDFGVAIRVPFRLRRHAPARMTSGISMSVKIDDVAERAGCDNGNAR